MKTFRDRLLTATAGLFLALSTAGAVPPGFNIQGRLTDANGVNREGNYSIKFNLHDAVTGGTALWTRTYPALTVRNGNFQTVLGDVTGQPMLSDVFASGDSRFLEIQVLSGPGVTSPEAPLVPRQQLVSVAYAFRSQNAVFSDQSSTASYAQVANTLANTAYRFPNADGGPGQVLATDGHGNLSWANVVPPAGPTLASATPASGFSAGGAILTLTGTGFQGGATVTMGGTLATGVIVVNSTQIRATIPPHAEGVVDVLVKNPDNLIATLVGGFTYTLPGACANGSPNQIFTQGLMVSCPAPTGWVTFPNAQALCNQAYGWHLCSFAEYQDRRASKVPSGGDAWLVAPSGFSIGTYNWGAPPAYCQSGFPYATTTSGGGVCTTGAQCGGTVILNCTGAVANGSAQAAQCCL